MRQQPLTPRPFSRRRTLGLGLGILGVAAIWRASSAANALTLTPPQTAGPFYPQIKPLDADADLLRVAGQGEPGAGTPIHLLGRVLDPAGRAIDGAQVEIWQCDAFGVYHHPLDTARYGRNADPRFQGYGRSESAADGGYRFRTIRPVAYPGRTPHIHFRLTAPNSAPLTTQMYVAGEPLNETDFLLARIRDPAARQRVMVSLDSLPVFEGAALAGVFDIILGA